MELLPYSGSSSIFFMGKIIMVKKALLILFFLLLSTFIWNTKVVFAEETNISDLRLVGTPSAPGKVGWVFGKDGFMNIPDNKSVISEEEFTLNAGLRYINLNRVEWFQVFKDRAPQILKKGGLSRQYPLRHPAWYTLKSNPIQLHGNNSDDYYFQIAAIGYNSPPKYSSVIKVHVNSKNVNPTGIEVYSDKSYLNSFEKYTGIANMKARLKPDNANGKVRWSSNDDPSIATVDPDTGVVTASTKGEKNTFTVTGTIKSDNSKTFSDSFTFKVGKGLDDVEEQEGGTAVFNIQGDIVGHGEKIIWYRLKNNGKKIKLKKQPVNPEVLKIEHLEKKKHNNKYFFAEIIPQTGTILNKDNLLTNVAKLTVTSSTFPKILMDFSLKNNTFDLNQTPNRTYLNQVATNDEIYMVGTISDENENSRLKKGSLTFNVPDNSQDVQIQFDGKQIQYIRDGNKIKIDNLDFKQKNSQPFQILVKYRISGYSETPYQGTIHFEEQSEDKNIQLVKKDFESKLLMDFSNYNINMTASSLDFLVNRVNGQTSSKYAKVNNPNGEILHIEDNRIVHQPIGIYLKLDDLEENDFSPTFYYHFKNSSLKITPGQWIEVEEARNGEKLQSITGRNRLEMVLPKQSPATGSFKARFEWTFRPPSAINKIA